MDEKKVREAIAWMENERTIHKYGTYVNSSIPKEKISKVGEYYDLAIEALEKQLPKKGIKEKITKGANKGLHKYYCPICYDKGDLSNKCNVRDYCSDCGQRLDWSE